MNLAAVLLLVAFKYRIKEPDIGTGLARFEAILHASVDEGEFRLAVASAVVAGHLLDPVRLPPGALQCHWHLQLTPKGVSTVRARLHGQDRTVDEQIGDALPWPSKVFVRHGI